MMCPYYLLYGMSYDDYWYGKPNLVAIYKKMYALKNEEINQQMWLQGGYFLNALQVVIGNAFGKKGQKSLKYLDKPFDISQDEEIKAQRAEAERKKIINYFDNLKAKWDKKNG